MTAHCLCCALSVLGVFAAPEASKGSQIKADAIRTVAKHQKTKPKEHHSSTTARDLHSGEALLSEAERLRAEWSAESLRRALDLYRSAQVVFKQADEKAGQAKAFLGEGDVLVIFGKERDALAQYRRGLELARLISEIRLQIDILNRITRVEIESHDRAYELHAQRASSLAEHESYELGLAEALNNLAVIAYFSNDPAKAIDYSNRAFSLWSKAGNLAGQAESLTRLGLTYGESGSVSKALEFFERGLTYARASSDRRKEVRLNLAVALVHMSRGEWQKALDVYRGTVLSLRRIGDRPMLAIALNGLGDVYEELGEVSQSLAIFTESLALARQMGRPGYEELALLHIAEAQAGAGREREALRSYRGAIRIARMLRDAKLEAYALMDVGLIYQSLGKLESALSYYDRAITVGKSLQYPRVQAYCQTQLGALYLRMNKPIEARAQQDTALALMRQAGDHAGEELILYNIARLKQYRGEIDSALTDTRRIIQLTEAQNAEFLNSDLKASYFGSIHRSYEMLVDLLMQKHNRAPMGGHDIAALEASELGRARSLGEMLTEARTNLREGVPAELLEKENVALASLRKKATEEMSLREVRFKLTQMKTPEAGNRAEKLSRNRRELDSVSYEITQLTAQLDQTATDIAAKMPKKYANLLRTPSVNLKELQDKLLDTESLALEYSLGDDHSYLWIIGPDSLTSYVLPGRAEIDREAQTFYNALTSLSTARKQGARLQRSRANLSTLNTARDKLSETLLAPIAGVAASKRLVIIPDGALEYIPFSDLVDPDSKQPLVVGHQIAMLPSLRVLLEIRDETSNRASAPKTIAVVADPVVDEHDPRLPGTHKPAGPRAVLASVIHRRGLSPFEGARNPFDTSAGVDDAVNFVRLPFAAEEAEMLVNLVPESERLVATGFEANRQLASSEALRHFRIIHFATHGLLDFRHARLSCLVLSRFDQKGEPQDGYFRLQDVYQMKLSAELVVLSACQTALGKQIRGEGLVGLTRGFFYAGAARVAASLWNVDDNASAKLMERFYRKMLGPEKMPAAAALRAAQIEMMREKRWEDPYYWAAFVLQGEWK
jgi:CHAT domain-containing protein/tetratricopeptide (TPR) repeat protein